MNTALTASLRLSLSSCRVARRIAAGPVRAMVSSLCGSAGRSHCSARRAARNTLETPPPARCRVPPLVQAAAAGGGGNTYHVLQYNYVPDILEKRGPFREQHLAGANTMVRPGKEAQPAPCTLRTCRVPPLLSLSCMANSWVLQAEQNKLVMAGALTDPVDGAIFIFR